MDVSQSSPPGSDLDSEDDMGVVTQGSQKSLRSQAPSTQASQRSLRSKTPSTAASTPRPRLQKGNKNTWLDQDQDPFFGKTPKQVATILAECHTAKRLGPRTLKDWIASLKKKYGNLVRAWRLALDVDGNGSLTYNEFGPAVRALGYEGSIRALWRELDQDDGGEVSLAEFDFKSAQLLGKFKEHLLKSFQDAQTIWANLSLKGLESLSCEQFERGCKKLGWEDKTRLVHSLLDSSLAGCKTISVQDIEWLGIPPHPPSMHPVCALKLRQAAFLKGKLSTLGAHDVVEFKAYLKRMCGSIVRAWRLKLDVDGNGSLTYNEFGPAVRSLGYEGSIKLLWQQLDADNSGWISLNELDVKSARSLESFKAKLLEEFPTAQAAWRRLAPGGLKTLTRDKFREACKILGWKGPADAVHRMLDSDVKMSGHVKIHDFEWLGRFPTGVSATNASPKPASGDDGADE